MQEGEHTVRAIIERVRLPVNVRSARRHPATPTTRTRCGRATATSWSASSPRQWCWLALRREGIPQSAAALPAAHQHAALRVVAGPPGRGPARRAPGAHSASYRRERFDPDEYSTAVRGARRAGRRLRQPAPRAPLLRPRLRARPRARPRPRPRPTRQTATRSM